MFVTNQRLALCTPEPFTRDNIRMRAFISGSTRMIQFRIFKFFKFCWTRCYSTEISSDTGGCSEWEWVIGNSYNNLEIESQVKVRSFSITTGTLIDSAVFKYKSFELKSVNMISRDSHHQKNKPTLENVCFIQICKPLAVTVAKNTDSFIIYCIIAQFNLLRINLESLVSTSFESIYLQPTNNE